MGGILFFHQPFPRRFILTTAHISGMGGILFLNQSFPFTLVTNLAGCFTRISLKLIKAAVYQNHPLFQETRMSNTTPADVMSHTTSCGGQTDIVAIATTEIKSKGTQEHPVSEFLLRSNLPFNLIPPWR
jgi:hypothetical protein